jgi:hypothetical protein
MSWEAVAVVLAALAGQAFWIGRALADLGSRIDRVDARLDRIETTVLRDHGERIARLEERATR